MNCRGADANGCIAIQVRVRVGRETRWRMSGSGRVTCHERVTRQVFSLASEIVFATRWNMGRANDGAFAYRGIQGRRYSRVPRWPRGSVELAMSRSLENQSAAIADARVRRSVAGRSLTRFRGSRYS